MPGSLDDEDTKDSADMGGNETRVSTAVVRTLAAETNQDPSELPRLYDSVDPDALDAVFVPLGDGRLRESGQITFPYAGYEVAVAADGTITLTPLDET